MVHSRRSDQILDPRDRPVVALHLLGDIVVLDVRGYHASKRRHNDDDPDKIVFGEDRRGDRDTESQELEQHALLVVPRDAFLQRTEFEAVNSERNGASSVQRLLGGSEG